MALRNYRDLEVWQRAMDLAVAVYHLSGDMPKHERYGLTAQLRGSAGSIPANIAEGYGRMHQGDYVHHLSIARGSLAELETHLTLAVRLGLLKRDKGIGVADQCQDVGKMLRKLIRSLESRARP
jgi:four helix bundle protein